MSRPIPAIEGIHVVPIRRPGKPVRWYVYAWRGGPCVLKGIGSARPKLTNDVLKLIIAARADANAPATDTLMSLCRQWRSMSPNRPSSPEWDKLADSTKKTWGSQLNLIEEKWGKTPLAVWSDPRMTAMVVKWRNSRRATPRAADLGVTVLRRLLEFGRLGGAVSINVANDIPTLYRGGERADIIWLEADFDAFIRKATELDQGHLIDGLLLAALTGLRRQDLVTLTWKHIGEHAIFKKLLKRSAGKRQHLNMPIHPELEQLLEALRSRHRQPGVETLLVNSHGSSWTGDGFGGSFNRVRDAAGIYHVDEDTGAQKRKHLHDIRGTFATKVIAGSDLTDAEIAGMMGWVPERVRTIRRVYVDEAKVAVALGERIAGAFVKHAVKHPSGPS